MVAWQWFALWLAMGLLAYLTYLKFKKPPSWFFTSHLVRRLNFGWGAALLPLILGLAAFFLKRAVAAHRAKATWTHRRRALCNLAALQLAVTLVNVGVWLGVSVYCSAGCPSLATRHAASTASFVSASSWNAILLLSLIGAHNLLPAELVWMAKRLNKLLPVVNPVASSSSSDMASKGALVLDLPWVVHLPKVLLLWMPNQLVITLMLLYGLGAIGECGAALCHFTLFFSLDPKVRPRLPARHTGPTSCLDGAFCGSIRIISAEGPCSEWVYSCIAEKWATVLSVATASLFLFQMNIFLLLIWLGIREYRRRSYADYRLANLLLRLMVRACP